MFYGYVNLMDDWEIDDENGLHMSFDLVEVEHVFKPLKSRADFFGHSLINCQEVQKWSSENSGFKDRTQ